jgi:hypothetical protein
MTEQAPAVPVPKAMVLTRLAFAAGGALGLAYVVLGPLELSHLDAGYAAATHYVALPDVYAVASSIRDFTGLAIGASVIAAATMLPFAAGAVRVRDRLRITMIVVSVVVGLLALIVTMSDASTLITGAVFTTNALVTADDAARASSLVVASWFPLVHYVTAFGLMAAGVVGAAALSTSSVREYVRRHDQAGPDDPRLWTLPKRDAT